MATPHVAAVAALMKAVYPAMTPNQFDNLLSAGDITDDIGDSGRDNDFGHGLINAYKAVQAADNLAGGGSITPVAVLESTPSELILGTNSSMSLTLENINNNATDPEVTAEVSEDWMSLDDKGKALQSLHDRAAVMVGEVTSVQPFKTEQQEGLNQEGLYQQGLYIGTLHGKSIFTVTN